MAFDGGPSLLDILRHISEGGICFGVFLNVDLQPKGDGDFKCLYFDKVPMNGSLFERKHPLPSIYSHLSGVLLPQLPLIKRGSNKVITCTECRCTIAARELSIPFGDTRKTHSTKLR